MNITQFEKLILGDTVYQKDTGKVLKFWQVHTPANAKHEPIIKLKSIPFNVSTGDKTFIKISKSAFLEQYAK